MDEIYKIEFKFLDGESLNMTFVGVRDPDIVNNYLIKNYGLSLDENGELILPQKMYDKMEVIKNSIIKLENETGEPFSRNIKILERAGGYASYT